MWAWMVNILYVLPHLKHTLSGLWPNGKIKQLSVATCYWMLHVHVPGSGPWLDGCDVVVNEDHLSNWDDSFKTCTNENEMLWSMNLWRRWDSHTGSDSVANDMWHLKGVWTLAPSRVKFPSICTSKGKVKFIPYILYTVQELKSQIKVLWKMHKNQKRIPHNTNEKFRKNLKRKWNVKTKNVKCISGFKLKVW